MPARSVVVVGPVSLANYLTRETPDVSPQDIETDIRTHPEIYYPDYQSLCAELGMKRTLSEDGWKDLCRS